MTYDQLDELYDFNLIKGKSKSNNKFNTRNKGEKKKDKPRYNQKFIRNKMKNNKK